MAQANFDDLYLFALAVEADENINNFNLEKYYHNEFLFSGPFASFPSPQEQIVSSSPPSYPTAEYFPSPPYPVFFETPMDFQWHTGPAQYEYDPTWFVGPDIQVNLEAHNDFGNDYGAAYSAYDKAAHHDERVQKVLPKLPTSSPHHSPGTSTYVDSQTCQQPVHTPRQTLSINLSNSPTNYPNLFTKKSTSHETVPARKSHSRKAQHYPLAQTVAATLRQQQYKINREVCSVSLSREAEKHNTKGSIEVPEASAVASSGDRLTEQPAHDGVLPDGRASLTSGAVKRNAYTAVDFLPENGRPEPKPARKDFKFIQHNPLAPKKARKSKRKATEDLLMAQAIFDDLYLFALAAEADDHIKNFNLEKYHDDGFSFSGLFASFPSPQQQIVSNSPHGYPIADYFPSPAYPALFETPLDFQWHSGPGQYDCNPTCLVNSITQADTEAHHAFGNAYGTAYPSYDMAAHHDEPFQQALQMPPTPVLHYSPLTATSLGAQAFQQTGYSSRPTSPSTALSNNPANCPNVTNHGAACRRMPSKNRRPRQAPSCLPTQTVADGLLQQQPKINPRDCSVSFHKEAEQSNNTHRSIQVPRAAVTSSEERLIERRAHYEALHDGRTSSASGAVKRKAYTAVDFLPEDGRPEPKPAGKNFKFIQHNPLAPKKVRKSKRKATEDPEIPSSSASERPAKRLRMATASPSPASQSSSAPSPA
ncbi:hypothetical protein CVT26_011989 [Gymnopilus dilepis]|uniref:Uncharacterized protein n=1 Tax=Gymnopilus dilepis TaxID=231916 RepID=A0A409VYK5_9AGAR|nr:hypothetical protein CVT26_011989 [Gymnopilus dilepis]